MVVSNPCTSDARVIKVARAARDAGHDVHVFGTATRDTPAFEVNAGITFHRFEWRPAQLLLSTWPLKAVAALSRPMATWLAKRVTPYLKYRLFTRVFARHLAAARPDLLHAHDLICLPAAAAAAELCGARLVYDAHELETHRSPPLPWLQKLFVARTERRHSRAASAVITVGDSIAKLLSRWLGRPQVHVIYNSPVIEPCPRNIRSDVSAGPATRLIVYVGKVTIGRGLESVLRVLHRVQNAVLVTVGPSDPKQALQLRQLAQRAGVGHRFRMLPPVPFEQVVEYIRGANLGIISVEPITLSYQLCMPNKLFELSFAGVPIISNQLDDIAIFLSELGMGSIVDFDDEASLVYAIERALNSSPLPTSEQAQALADGYSWDAQCRKLSSIYTSVLGS